MSNFTIYHNPRCSKSRQTLEILNKQNAQVEIVLYLEKPPSAREIQSLLDKLGLCSRDIIRKGEKEYKTLKLDDESLDSESLIKSMVENPILIERPIVVSGNEARLGRPPELVLELL